MNKIVIGVFPTIKLFLNNDPYQDRYEFINNYPKRLYESGAIPVGILLNDGKLNYDVLDMCDAFLLPGGFRVDKELYKLLEYAYTNKKSVLGVCLGMQAMSIYSTMKEECLNNNVDYNDLESQSIIYEKVKKENPILNVLEDNNIHAHYVERDTIDTARHDIKLDKNSFLYNVYQKDSISVVSLHGVAVKRIGNIFKSVAIASDNVIEAIESVNNDLFWIGVQYHPEIDDNDNLIKEFVKEAIKRKK